MARAEEDTCGHVSLSLPTQLHNKAFLGFIKTKRLHQFWVTERVHPIYMFRTGPWIVQFTNGDQRWSWAAHPTNILSRLQFISVLNWDLCSSGSDSFDVDDVLPGRLWGPCKLNTHHIQPSFIRWSEILAVNLTCIASVFFPVEYELTHTHAHVRSHMPWAHF